MLAPFACLGVLEGGLRLVGYGSGYPLFVESPEAPGYLEPNADVISRYFAAEIAPALGINESYFLQERPADGLRIFVQGGSTAAGFPIGSSASIAGMLGFRLRQSFPGRPVEVVDTALSAVNSHTLLDFADEIIAEAPDAVVIYAGHNEFLGLFGVGSVYSGAGSYALTRLMFALDTLRSYQLARSLYVKARLIFAGPGEPDAKTLMAVIAKRRDMPEGSGSYRRGIGQFRRNLERLLDKYKAAGIPVFVGTVASNLKDQPPFASTPLPADAAAEAEATLAAIDDGRFDAVANGSLERIETLAAQHASAALYFAAARAREHRGDHAAAADDYALARDHDVLRFRAPSAINEVIRELAQATNAHLVDTEARLAAESGNGLIGSELMLEHLHPNVEGYFLIADQFYLALRDSGVLGEMPRFIPTDAARREIPVLRAERYFQHAAIAHLKSDFPFSDTPREPELPPISGPLDELGHAFYTDSIDWFEMAEAERDLLADDPLARAIASRLIADARPYRSDLNARAARDLLAADRPAEALPYIERAGGGAVSSD